MARTVPQNSPTPSSLHEWPRAPEFAAAPLDLALIVLDRFGVVDNCTAAAERLFGSALPGLLGRHVNGVIPGIPLRHRTPGYNLAYAAFWSGHRRYRRFTGIDARGNSLELDVRLERLPLNGNQRILLDVRHPACGGEVDESRGFFMPAAGERSACL